MSAWINYLTKFYREKKLKNGNYKYSSAMKDARVGYNSRHKGRNVRHTRKNRRSRKNRR